MRGKEVKVRSKSLRNLNLYLTIVDSIKTFNKLPPSNELRLSKQRMNWYISRLKDKGVIKKMGYGVWQVNDKKLIEFKKQVKVRSLGARADKPTTNLHALNIKIPILKGKIKDTDWQLKEKLNNWLPKYKELDILGGLTIKNNNNRSISIFAKSRNIKDINEVDNLSFKIRAYINEYMRLRGVVLDVFNAETKNINMATQDKDAESMIKKGEKFELDLMKKAEKIFPVDNINAKAWIDGSPFKFSAETNDKDWKREYLRMPFSIREMLGIQRYMAESISYVAENYKSHVGVVEEAHKIFKKINKQLKQTSLKKWI